MSKKEQQYQDFKKNRDHFIYGGDTFANAIGLTLSFSKKYAASKSRKTLLGASNFGSASIQQADYSDKWLGTSKIVGPIQPVSESQTGFKKAASGEFGEIVQNSFKEFEKRDPLLYALGCMGGVISAESVVDGPVAEEKLPVPDPELMTRHIKDLAKFLRGDEVGVGLMPAYAYYSSKIPEASIEESKVGKKSSWKESDLIPVTTNHKYAISILVDQDLDTLLGSTGHDGISCSQSYMSYYNSGAIACTIAAYIRNMGYSARAHHAFNYQVIVPPVLIACGLGELTRTGECVAHPRLGFRFKAAVVTTDLPMLPDKPIGFGMREFCVNCKKCAEHCPSQAISHDKAPTNHNGYEKWATDVQKCTTFRICNKKGIFCGTCMSVCPWSNKEESWFHSIGLWASSKSSIAAKLLKNIDDFFGYGTEQAQENRWWLEWPELYAGDRRLKIK